MGNSQYPPTLPPCAADAKTALSDASLPVVPLLALLRHPKGPPEAASIQVRDARTGRQVRRRTGVFIPPPPHDASPAAPSHRGKVSGGRRSLLGAPAVHHWGSPPGLDPVKAVELPSSTFVRLHVAASSSSGQSSSSRLQSAAESRIRPVSFAVVELGGRGPADRLLLVGDATGYVHAVEMVPQGDMSSGRLHPSPHGEGRRSFQARSAIMGLHRECAGFFSWHVTKDALRLPRRGKVSSERVVVREIIPLPEAGRVLTMDDIHISAWDISGIMEAIADVGVDPESESQVGDEDLSGMLLAPDAVASSDPTLPKHLASTPTPKRGDTRSLNVAHVLCRGSIVAFGGTQAYRQKMGKRNIIRLWDLRKEKIRDVLRGRESMKTRHILDAWQNQTSEFLGLHTGNGRYTQRVVVLDRFDMRGDATVLSSQTISINTDHFVTAASSAVPNVVLLGTSQGKMVTSWVRSESAFVVAWDARNTQRPLWQSPCASNLNSFHSIEHAGVVIGLEDRGVTAIDVVTGKLSRRIDFDNDTVLESGCLLDAELLRFKERSILAEKLMFPLEGEVLSSCGIVQIVPVGSSPRVRGVVSLIMVGRGV